MYGLITKRNQKLNKNTRFELIFANANLLKRSQLGLQKHFIIKVHRVVWLCVDLNTMKEKLDFAKIQCHPEAGGHFHIMQRMCLQNKTINYNEYMNNLVVFTLKLFSRLPPF